MPTYQYACTECGHDFEQVQAFSDDSLTECPTCEGRLRKVFNAVGVVFKGSGFYRNDSRKPESSSSSSESGSSTKTESRSESTSESTSGSTSDSKPASTSDPKPASKPASKASA